MELTLNNFWRKIRIYILKWDSGFILKYELGEVSHSASFDKVKAVVKRAADDECLVEKPK